MPGRARTVYALPQLPDSAAARVTEVLGSFRRGAARTAWANPVLVGGGAQF
jgi:hypothetical protein